MCSNVSQSKQCDYCKYAQGRECLQHLQPVYVATNTSHCYQYTWSGRFLTLTSSRLLRLFQAAPLVWTGLTIRELFFNLRVFIKV